LIKSVEMKKRQGGRTRQVGEKARQLAEHTDLIFIFTMAGTFADSKHPLNLLNLVFCPIHQECLNFAGMHTLLVTTALSARVKPWQAAESFTAAPGWPWPCPIQLIESDRLLVTSDSEVYSG
jgi:hypothetical protein